MGLRGLEDKSSCPSLSLQPSSTSLLPTHPHEGLPVSSAAPAHPGSGPLVPSPRALLPDPPWLLLTLGSHGRPPRNGLPPLGLSDLLRALTTLHSLHQALRAQHSSPLLCYHLRAWFPSLSSPLRSARETRSLAHHVVSRAQSCASLAVLQQPVHMCVVGEPAPVFSLQLPSARMWIVCSEQRRKQQS